MSVLITLRVNADATKIEATDPATMQSIVERAKSMGCIAHHFYGTDDEVLVVDEWPDEASFHAFFDASPDIAAMMGAAGVNTAPGITAWRKLDTGDEVG